MNSAAMPLPESVTLITAFAFSQDQMPIRTAAIESLLAAIRPHDADRCHRRDFTEPEMRARIVTAEETLTRLRERMPAPRARFHADFRADRIATAECGIDGAHRAFFQEDQRDRILGWRHRL